MVVQIVSLADALTAVDQTRAMIQPVVLQQIVMNLSVLTAVVLSLHGFFTNLTTGRLGGEVRDTSHQISEVSSEKGRRTNVSRKVLSSVKADRATTLQEIDSTVASLRPDLVHKGNAWATRKEESDWEDGRSEGSQENIIQQTVIWQVSRNERGGLRDEDELQMLPVSGETRARNFLT